MTSAEATAILTAGSDRYVKYVTSCLNDDMKMYRGVCRLKWIGGTLNPTYRRTVEVAKALVAKDLQIIKENS